MATLGAFDKEGFLRDLNAWSPAVAEQIAMGENLELTPAHWEIVNLLREYYQKFDSSPTMRALVKYCALKLGPDKGRVAMVGWGSTYGAIYQAVRQLRRTEPAVSHIHLRYLSPLPRNLGELLARFDRVIVPEMNNGQLATLLRDKLGIEVIQHNKVSGQPFQVRELVAFVRKVLAGDQMRNVVPMVQGERS